MFGIKIISEEKYRSEQETARKLVKINEDLTKKDARLELDIKSLREQNTKLRSINAKRKDENDALAEKNRKLKDVIKGHEAFRKNVKAAFPQVDFLNCRPVACNHKCTECDHEETTCKKYTDLSVCMLDVHSFRGNK